MKKTIKVRPNFLEHMRICPYCETCPKCGARLDTERLLHEHMQLGHFDYEVEEPPENLSGMYQ